ncbi:biosynthetic arginine decarboxylase [Leptolyngbya cf. ectocarpi LEGE 11479]|uniref:Biosynthetic arginine decarboxylase n=1 Tax=Leptolyngbya cf. ectocarpi LEGE 11479 TaxID=1828722 RepID=A0A928ZSN0_LEPEC|nr:biosynthetic arginine decarboxylase [Leptolyngbya ectocarpi]MBE9065471.1 biosynthetic arginine decarboxylase [Leptolyngbya cf. ectocarpi LEGE 11479]
MTSGPVSLNQQSMDAIANTDLPPGKKLSPENSPWTIEDSEELYRINGWGEPYFSINAAGNVIVSPQGDRGGSLDLHRLIQALEARNLSLPILVRFSDILEDRIERLNSCFAKAITKYGYDGRYQGVFPIKCNQQRHLIEDLVTFGQRYQFGLEAGSKPELMIALATLKTPGALLICNGYKDRAYLETAMLGQKLGQQPIIVLEQLDELPLVIEVSQQLNIQPRLGVRAKLCSKGIGRWGGSAGDRAKFGLTIPEILTVVDQLRSAEMLSCLQLLHFHIGSQMSSISIIKDALREACQIYVELVNLGANMQYLDVGGGLGVDYNGSKTNVPASKNYSIQNYANDVVAEVQEACTAKNLPVPTLISESGRAIASHQSVLVFDVLGSSEVRPQVPFEPSSDDHAILKELYEAYQSINSKNYQEAFHDAEQFKGEAVSLFNFGYLSLTERARVENLFWACCQKIIQVLRQEEYVPDDLAHLEKMMASIYYINLSVFQSAPDTWAIDQLFPIMPIHRLNEEPTCRATLADLTCDSDGKIDQFIDLHGVKSVLELHALQPDEPYYLGMFLNGAYQEIMGNLHNLFGDTNMVHIHLTPQGYTIEHVVKGDTMKEVLSYVQYDAEDLVEQIRRRSEISLKEKQITLPEAQLLLQNYEESLSRYTYLS